VQLRFHTGLTSEDYVSQRAWRLATLPHCPLHPKGGCGFARHGVYARLTPPGARVARWYCPRAHCTFSLLPDSLAARWSADLREVEHVVDTVEQLGSVEAAAHLVRDHDVLLPSAIRWTRRRLNAVRALLVTLVGLLPEHFSGCQPTLGDFRRALGVELVLPALRPIAAPHLQALPAPLGFSARSSRRSSRPSRRQHATGPDPPRSVR
jgi:hypothetical protein